MSGVDNMIYMYSTSASSGSQMNLRVDFDVTTNPSTDQVLAQMRYAQAEAQLPQQVTEIGVTIRKASASPLILFSLYSPKGTYDPLFISNYAYININDPMTRVPGVGQVQIFGDGQYAMRVWVRPGHAGQARRHGQRRDQRHPGAERGQRRRPDRIEPGPPGPGVRVHGARARAPRRPRRSSATSWSGRAPTGRWCGVKDVARVELGAQTYNVKGRLNGRPAAIIAVYQLPGSNAIATVERAKALMKDGEDALSRRSRVRRVARHDPGGDRGHRRDREDAVRGAGAGHRRGLHLPAGLPGHPDPAAGRAGVAGRDVRGVPPARLLHQHAVAVRAGAGHRAGGGRRHRGGRGRRAPHRAGPAPARGHARRPWRRSPGPWWPSP